MRMNACKLDSASFCVVILDSFLFLAECREVWEEKLQVNSFSIVTVVVSFGNYFQ